MSDSYFDNLLPKDLSQRRSLAIYNPSEKGKTLIDLSHNDYLGIGEDIELGDDFQNRLINKEYGDIKIGSTSSRMLFVNTPIYSRLEDSLARAYKKEAALLFNSGYHANVGILPAISNKKSLVLADKLVHASLIDGIRLSDADKIRYRHNDYQQLEHILESKAKDYELVFILTEAIFSMDGDMADLKRLVSIKKTFDNVFLYIDEAHSFGVRGDFGLGLAYEEGLLEDIDILVGTFGKSYASIGAFVVAKQSIIDVLVNFSRPLIFSTAFPPINAAWSYYLFNSKDIIQDKRLQLSKIANYTQKSIKIKFKESLIRLANDLDSTNSSMISRALDYLEKSCSHIIPIVLGSNEKALGLAEHLRQNDIIVKAIRPPTVPINTARVRLSLNSSLNTKDIDKVINCIISYLSKDF